MWGVCGFWGGGSAAGATAWDVRGAAWRRECRCVPRRRWAGRRAIRIRPSLSESSRAWLTDQVPLLTRIPRLVPLPAGVVRATASDCWPLFTMWGTRRAGSGVNQRARFSIGSCNPSGLRRKLGWLRATATCRPVQHGGHFLGRGPCSAGHAGRTMATGPRSWLVGARYGANAARRRPGLGRRRCQNEVPPPP